jgi:tRNA threonylcarbamoyladenosine biosynthesis protein TsaB
LNILALETSTEHCSVALLCGERLLSRETLAGQRHSELVLPMVDAVLREAGLALSALDGIAFGAGPGSFTGLRIACGVAQGLAFGAGLTLAPVGTLLALARAAGARRVLACLDARMGEINHAAYEKSAMNWREVSGPWVCAADAAPALPGGGWVGCGSGFAVHGDSLQRHYSGQLAAVRPGLFPHAREVALEAVPVFSRGAGVAPHEASPVYVRDKVALTTAERA